MDMRSPAAAPNIKAPSFTPVVRIAAMIMGTTKPDKAHSSTVTTPINMVQNVRISKGQTIVIASQPIF